MAPEEFHAMNRGMKVATLALTGCALFASFAHAQWRPLGLSGQRVNRLSAHGGFLYACTSEGLFKLSFVDPDTVWSPTGFSGQEVLDLASLGPQTLLAAKRLTAAPDDTVSLFRSVDDGQTWQPFQNGFGAGTTSGRQARRIAILPASPGALLAASSRMEKSTDGGLSWRVVTQAAVVNALEVAPADPQLVWAGGETAIFSPYVLKSSDAGETWKQYNPFAGGDNAVDAIAGHPTNSDIIYLGMEGRVMMTADGGTNWTTVTSPDPSMYTFGMAIRPWLPLKLYAAGASFTPDPRGVVFHQSVDGGLSWQAIAYPAEAGPGVNHLLLRTGSVEESLYVATGNGVHRHTQGVVSVPLVRDGNTIALRCSPNPLRESASIEFALPRAEKVRLRVLDVGGRVVATLLDEVVESGVRGARWDAKRARSGIYMAVLQVGDEVRSFKMVRVR
jgi:photosystem II stability/assembly factor-like uncharacterized protein